MDDDELGDLVEACYALMRETPMPGDLRQQVATLIEPFTINMGIKHGDVMTCVRLAFTAIKPYLREHEEPGA